MNTNFNMLGVKVTEKEERISKTEFVNMVNGGLLNDADGYGLMASATMKSNKPVYPSKIKHVLFRWPTWATHVVWHGKL
jgi:hypothetical protein